MNVFKFNKTLHFTETKNYHLSKKKKMILTKKKEVTGHLAIQLIKQKRTLIALTIWQRGHQRDKWIHHWWGPFWVSCTGSMTEVVQPLDGGVRWGACVPHDGGEEGVREAPHSVGGRGDRCTRKTWCQDTACLFFSFTPFEVKSVQNKCKSSLVTDVTFRTDRKNRNTHTSQNIQSILYQDSFQLRGPTSTRKRKNKLFFKSYPFIKNLCHNTRWNCEVFNPRNWPVNGSINESFNKWLTTHACVVVELADLNVTYKIPLLHVLNSNTTLNQKKHSINWLSKQTVSHSSASANFPLRQSEATFPS